ncbi:MAG: hypothetical protein KIS67_27770 [Verrucomicrobiae bacterium]|nr:hypothetical protein [Verrucomicrobiae bacterium]
MNRLDKLGRIFLLLLFLAGLGAGCATTDPDNLSARPWNSPKQGYGTGLPPGMMEGR